MNKYAELHCNDVEVRIKSLTITKLKSSFALYSLVYRPLMEHLHDDNFKVLYVSLEMSAMSMFIKLMSIYIFEKFGKKLSYKEILSRKKGYVLDDEG